MIHYNPFKDVNDDVKDFNKISYNDLDVLKNIKEDYSIEYKREYNQNVKEEKMPKAISAFSNRSGGWFFIGINNDGTINDIDLSSITEESIYSSIESRVSPTPILDLKLLCNPNDQTKGVIMIYVHKGNNTPYIANGTVFVRNGKSSDPADRSSLDILFKQSMEHSDIKLCCLDCQLGFFTADTFKLDSVYNQQKYVHDRNLDMFYDIFANSKQVELYIENSGKHYDESIELVIKVHKNNFFNIENALLNYQSKKCEDILRELLTPTQMSDIKEFRNDEFSLTTPPPFEMPSLFGADNSREYVKEYMLYLAKNEYPFEIVKEGEYYYLKANFKNINPGQKMFLPATLLVCRNITSLEYSITSKYSTGKILGKLSFVQLDR